MSLPMRVRAETEKNSFEFAAVVFKRTVRVDVLLCARSTRKMFVSAGRSKELKLIKYPGASTQILPELAGILNENLPSASVLVSTLLSAPGYVCTTTLVNGLLSSSTTCPARTEL